MQTHIVKNGDSFYILIPHLLKEFTGHKIVDIELLDDRIVFTLKREK